MMILQNGLDFKISIHALVKRATQGTPATASRANFNPRPREEGDQRHHGRRRTARNFNPRPREEGDGSSIFFILRYVISIHALVKRATY